MGNLNWPLTTDARIRPFRIDVPQDDLEDLRGRPARTRWGSEIPGADWSRGAPSDYLKALTAYWADGFDWRKAEAEPNEFPQFTTEIDGQNIHSLHVRSQNPAAVPLLVLHDWPCSFVQFVEAIEPPTQDFHVAVTSTPDTGFCGPLREAGWNTGRITGAFVELTSRLGYDAYGVQRTGGGAWILPPRRAARHPSGSTTFT